LHPISAHDYVLAKLRHSVEIRQCTIGICYCTIAGEEKHPRTSKRWYSK